MVLRILWNVGAGILHRVIHKKTMKPGLGLTYPSIWRARTGFLDCDVNIHLNNASYLYSMELARWHLVAVSGLLYSAVKNKRTFVVGSLAIRYRYPVAPFHPYEVRTQAVYWDASWLYFVHQIQCPKSGKIYAEALARTMTLQGRDRVAPAVLIAEQGFDLEDIPQSPEMPDIVKEFLLWDEATKKSMENGEAREKADLPNRPRGLLANLTRSMNLPFKL